MHRWIAAFGSSGFSVSQQVYCKHRVLISVA